MDISFHFHTYVKSITLHKKVIINSSEDHQNLKTYRKPSLFKRKTYVIINQIVKLYALLMNSKHIYLNFSNYLPNTAQITNNERDEIDCIAQNIIGTCSKLIKDLKRDIIMCNYSQQNQEHCEIVSLMIETYLRNICKIYLEQKAIRVQKALELQKIYKLEFTIKKKNSDDESNVKFENNKKMKNIATEILFNQEINYGLNENVQVNQDLTSEDIQIFEAENEQLCNELNTLTDEVRQIENKIVHISELQEVFTEKVLDQDKNLDRIITSVVGSTENVKQANEQIRKAIQRNAGLRVWVLFFLLIVSFTLIFLDWYNP